MKLKEFRLKQKGYDEKYQKKAWNEANEDPSLKKAMIYQRRLKVQKSKIKGISLSFLTIK